MNTMNKPPILVAGIGNIFLGDDAFGVEVARQLMQRDLPPQVQVVDFGIRSYDLAYALLEEPQATIMIDALPREGSPGSLYLLQLSMDDVALERQRAQAPVDAHSMNPVAALQLVKQYGGHPRRLYLVGCEPATFVAPDGDFGLSDAVQAAVAGAMDMVEELVGELLAELAV